GGAAAVHGSSGIRVGPRAEPTSQRRAVTMVIRARGMAQAQVEQGLVLAKVLWGQVVRAVHAAPPRWDPGAPSVRAMLEILHGPGLAADEEEVFARWKARPSTTRTLYDRLLEARVNRAVRSALELEARRAGLATAPEAPRVAIARTGGEDASAPGKTAVEIL